MAGLGAPAIADGAVRRRVLVVGSPPPGGRDLDLLVRPEEEAAIAAALGRHGFSVRGNTWARFAGGTADVVDLIPAAEWGRGDVLFDEGLELAGFEHLVLPAPHHDLLLAATRFLTPSGRLKASRMRRLTVGPARDPSAWRRARAEAQAWDAELGLERLAALFDGLPRRDVRASARALPRRLRQAGGAVVALSGADAPATAVQARALVKALDRLGYEAVVESGPPVPPRRAAPRGAAAAQAWATVVAVRDGVRHARRAARHRAAGRVVVFDRYVLDCAVRLRVGDGAGPRFGLQRRLLVALSPRPTVGFHLGAEPEVPAWREERDALDVRPVDAGRPADEVAAEIAGLVWRALS